ncbi:SusC/RagA family TonB-linked outer membrane protein [Spirosoma montaniterrae]|uniref:SusC/RagA family TonB-linked outer membrane protein n=1 Tax=Spirosoma montaniterrae TaxID=1178516 RepID=A0A1P9X3R3_9BACT|nr:TonB-dependent receptor [Spirosoma montaniterrae]AQG82261.1 SusC/RagA family TonB-linked outer membrane protein [Spirosoma montaniterrae]
MNSCTVYRLFGVVAALLLSLGGFAQTPREISGKVIDARTQESIPGTNVVVKGTTKGVVTNSEGVFKTTVNPGDVLVFTFIGYKAHEEMVGNQTMLQISLSASASNIDEVVVIGYGTAKKSDLTGSVVRINADQFKTQPITQLTDMLTGTVAGFYANQSASAAGGSTLEIRGPNSLNASTDPLVVLDGVIFNGSIRDINPADIETIDILKDASSTAVYGARAASGVIIVTTKRGKTGKPIISLSTKVGVATPTNSFKPMGVGQYLDFRRDVLRQANPALPSYYFYNPDRLPEGVTLEQWRTASRNPQADNTNEWLGRLRLFPVEIDNYLAGRTVDWYDRVIKPGVRQSHDLNISGGAERVNYFWSIGYDNNEGLIRGDKFSTVRTRLNVDMQVTDWLQAGVSAQYADRDESVVPADTVNMYRMSPYGSEFETDGRVKWFPHDYSAVANPLINYYGQDRLRRFNTLFASIYAKIKLPLGFDYRVSFQPRYEFGKDYNFWSSQTIDGGATRSNGYGTRAESSLYERFIDNLLHWNRSFGQSTFDVTLLYSSEQNRTWYTQLTNQTFVPNQNLGYHALQFGSNPSLTNNDTQINGDAAMGRLNYTLKDRYLFTASIRRDGYSAFGQKNPRANFPALALGWVISDEKFFQFRPVNRLKLRLSWGVNGNRAIGAYAALAQLSPNLYYNGSAVQVGVVNSTLSNPNLVWEKTKSINIGFDAGLLNNRIDITADYYDIVTTDLLMNRQLPQLTGFSSVVTNLGKLGNRGIELTVNTVNVNQRNLLWKSNFVFSLNRNKIRNLFGDYEEVEVNGQKVRREVPDYINQWFPGQPLDRVWNYDVTGIWQTTEAAEAARYRMVPGDFKAVDVNNNGVYEALADKQFIGYTQPRYRFGLRNDFTFMRHFTASFFVRADLGHIGPFAEALHAGSETYDRRNTYAIPYWTPENGQNEYARPMVNFNAYGGGIMIYKPRSFVRVQDVSLAYNLPAELSKRLKLNNGRVFVSARNLFTFSKWPGWDPESGNAPMPRILMIGLDFSL